MITQTRKPIAISLPVVVQSVSSSSSSSVYPLIFRTTTLGFKSNTVHLSKSSYKLIVNRTSSSNSDSAVVSKDSELNKDDIESAQLFEKLKDAERERINKLEQLENKANVQLERQIVMASYWSRALLTMRGKLRGTEWDPENSHKINYSEFWRLLNSNNVQFMEYSDFGQKVSGRYF